MFKKILIANRGEIAIRVMRACKEMGITPVAVYSDCDRNALHVSHSYESYAIGPSPSTESYLMGDKIIAAAKRCGAEALHPGYGFLAENADFAEACEKSGIAFIGPRPEAIRMMGEKLCARKIMSESGVPIIPGSSGPVENSGEASRIAAKIGYPVIIKASDGGGGKGMRIVHEPNEFEGALARTIGESKSAFGSGAVYIEKYISNPRHIEVQILADVHGGIISLGERECSMQRRYQKVIEEAPSTAVTPKLRSALSAAAVKAARAVDYTGAGTVEFILDDDRKFFFLEMNTRLQVEHPVTEMVYGCDIVKEQIRIASGERLVSRQEEVHIRGWAVEMRIYAEDPAQDFMPAAGTINRLSLPQGPGIRNDNGVYEGYEIPVYYDPLIGKVIVWDETRDRALKRAESALREYQLDGVRTNIDFLIWALHEKGFIDGNYDTNYIGRCFEPSKLHRGDEEIELATIAASIAAFKNLTRRRFDFESDDRESAWKRAARQSGLRKPLR